MSTLDDNPMLAQMIMMQGSAPMMQAGGLPFRPITGLEGMPFAQQFPLLSMIGGQALSVSHGSRFVHEVELELAHFLGLTEHVLLWLVCILLFDHLVLNAVYEVHEARTETLNLNRIVELPALFRVLSPKFTF